MPLIGDRIESEGHHGTVRYIGQVPPTKGMWLGIDWDETNRGKHDGSHKGVGYFTTHAPTSGSFLRPAGAHSGVNFLTALRDRYGLEAVDGGIDEKEMFILGPGQRQTAVEMVGAEKLNLRQSKFSDLLDVSLRQALVSGAGADGDIGDVSSRIRDLNLSANLISTWAEVARITSQLPQLYALNISDNRINAVSDTFNNDMNSAFLGLRILFANRMAYEWRDIVQCCAMWPQLQQLHVCFNDVRIIENPLPSMAALTLLNLEGNNIENWESVVALGVLPSLHTLILTGCGITEIRFPQSADDDMSDNSTTPLFPELRELTLIDNKISDWLSISELNKLSKLEQLSFRANPLLKANPGNINYNEDTLRYLIIARISRLTFLNRSEIEVQDRRGAELDYLKMFGLVWKKAGGDQDNEKNNPDSAFTLLHPRYAQLITKYGPPEDSELVVKTSALKNALLTLTFVCQQSTKPPLTKKIPQSMTIAKLRAMVMRLYSADPHSLVVTYSSPLAPGQDFQLDHDMREISYYAMLDGDTVNVSW